uniref:Elongator complex protein 6 n=1 Tax=Strigamia maritima TaxID=126957 RepID=T1IKJ4_STRMM
MFPVLGSALGYVDTNPAGKVFLINENTSDGSFVYHHLMHNHMRDDSIVCFVGTIQSLQHHCAIQSKHGLNLNTLQDSGKFIYIDAMKIYEENESNTPDLRKIVDTIAINVEKHFVKSIFLVIEDVSIFVSLGSSVADIVNFVRYCKSIIQPSANSSNCVAVLVHVDAENDEEIANLCDYLCDLCHVLVEIRNFSTGHFAHVDGEIAVKHLDDCERKNDFRMHFKLDERNLKLFAPGTSPTIL